MNENAITEKSSDFELDWIYARYENGDGVADIARQLDKSESYVYAKMRRVPEKYEDVKKIREENHNVRIRRVRGLADKIVPGYLEEVVDDSEKAASKISPGPKYCSRQTLFDYNAPACILQQLRYDRTVMGRWLCEQKGLGNNAPA